MYIYIYMCSYMNTTLNYILCMCMWCVFICMHTGLYRSVWVKVYESCCINVYTICPCHISGLSDTFA